MPTNTSDNITFAYSVYLFDRIYFWEKYLHKPVSLDLSIHKQSPLNHGIGFPESGDCRLHSVLFLSKFILT